jgi:hypothetical protein
MGRLGVSGGLETGGLWARDAVIRQAVARNIENEVLIEALSERLIIMLPLIMEGKLWRFV